ncbi:GBP4 protein, variant [Capsaspora owczarzaki ATCC 30864]|nr:GBP4 protein, variant [Capsaspora owczarzaki ATCC 30864]
MWLVRDFSLELVLQGETITPDDYLEQALQLVKGDPKRVAGKNQIRECIRSFFPNRTCFTLKRPVENEEDLQDLSNLSLEDFRPEYIEQVRILIRKIYHGVKTKKLFGSNLNGAMLAELSKNYVESINTGGVPVIRSAWENVLEIECKKASAAAERLYEKRMKDLVADGAILEEEELDRSHREAEKRAIDLFRSKAVGGPHTELEDELKNAMAEQLALMRKTNRARSAEQCELLLDTLARHISDDIRSKEITNIDQLHEEWERVVTDYLETAQGPMKQQVLFDRRREFFSTARRVAEGIVEATKEAAEKEVEAIREKSKVDYQRLDLVYKTVDTEWKKSQKENQQLTTEIKDLDLKIREMAQAQAASLERIKELQQELTESQDTCKRVQDERNELEEKERRIEEELQAKSQAIGALEHEKITIEGRLRGFESKKKKKCTIM